MPPHPIRLLSSGLLFLCLGLSLLKAAPVPTGNWSDITFTETNTTGIVLAFEKPSLTYTCLVDHITLGLQRVASSTVTVSSVTNVHVAWSSRNWTFEGTLSGDSNFLSGTFTTSGVPFAVNFQRQPSVDDCIAGSFVNGSGTLPYRLFVPPNYSTNTTYPLVVFLHGGNEEGTDNRIQMMGNLGFLNFISKTNQTRFPCFLAAPQCPYANAFDDTIRRVQVMGMVNKLKSQYSIDTNRIYVTGVSLGGVGSWDQITHYPSVYAAAIPMSGYGNTSLVSVITSVAVWNFHGTNDSVVPVSDSQQMVDALRRAGGKPIYTEYASGGHEVWVPAYYTPGLVEWTMAQTRGQPPTGFPLVSITTPTTNATYATSSTNLALTGTAGGTNADVWLVRALNARNNAVITATGSNTWSLNGLRLRTNTNNLVIVTAYGTTWMPRWKGTTSFNTVLRVNEIDTPIALTISATDQDATLQWTGGLAPYVVQQCTDVSGSNWSNIRTTSLTTITVPLEPNGAFYRVGVQ